MDKATVPGILELTPLNPEFNPDPHKFLDRLRNECPVHRDENAGTFIMTRYADVRGIVADTTQWRNPDHAEAAAVLARRVRDERIEGINYDEDSRKGILLLDDPDHARIRGPLAKALYKRVAKSRPLVQEVVDEILDRIGDEPRFDAMADFALLVPIDVIARILGVDRERLTEFRDWSEGVIQALNPFRTPEQTAHLVRSSNALSAYTRELMEIRRKKPEDDLVSDMVALQDEGASLTNGEISFNLGGLLVGGNLTTTDLIGNGIWLFLTHPDELAKLKADPALINSAVEEILRYESPVDITGRIASRDMEVGGCPVHKTQSMFLSLRGANRDPYAFPDPHRFDIGRKDAPHVAFGGGAHLCIGSPLARLEAQVALPTLFDRFPTLHLADPSEPAHWRSLPFFRGLETLFVER
ncbi:MAG: cytochrome P450 [Rhizomicrobium sp.]|jgi:cytochrome P450